MPDRMTPAERDKLIDDMVLKLRMSTDKATARPPPEESAFTRWLPTINVILGVCLAASIAGAGAAYRSSTTQMDQSTQDIRDLRHDLSLIHI